MSDFERQQSQIHSSLTVRPVRLDRTMHAEHAAGQEAWGNQAMQRFAQSCPAKAPSPSACPFGGACHACPARVQAKLVANEPSDQYEQEADRVADQVMAMPEPYTHVPRACPSCGEEEPVQTKPLAAQITPLVQRRAEREEDEDQKEPVRTKPSGDTVQRQEESEENEYARPSPFCEQTDPFSCSDRGCSRWGKSCEPIEPGTMRGCRCVPTERPASVPRHEAEEEYAQAKREDGQAPHVGRALRVQIQAMRGSGQPLPQSVRAFFEPRFGRDFGDVRVHADERAAGAALALNARAFTVGRDVAFGAGQYRPGTSEGCRLIAHELTHVLQQGTGRFVPSAQRRAFPTSNLGTNAIQRSIKKGTRCGGTWKCCPKDGCNTPDKAGDKTKSGEWQLLVRIDVDVPELQDIYKPSDVGHVYVNFKAPTGAAWSYGFYPAKSLLIEQSTTVAGCVVHPDTNHDRCVDYDETFSLTRAQFDAALSYAQDVCRTPPDYVVKDFTCTTFARRVAEKAGKSLPSGKGVLSRYYTLIESDWPNVVLDALHKRDERRKAEAAKEKAKKGGK